MTASGKIAVASILPTLVCGAKRLLLIFLGFLVTAASINDKHQIVGWAYSPNDVINPHAFLLTPNNLPLCIPD